MLALLMSTGAIGWAFSMYGTQREQSGSIGVLTQALTASRNDHDTVVRLEADYAHLNATIKELRQGQEQILAIVQDLRKRA
ncbi:MAG: hypothetical protein ACRDKE_07710 [Solirubrobacterales bacterium]